MGDPASWPQPSGLTVEGASLFAAAYSCSASKDDDWWAKAEAQTAELITSIQPNRPSERRREAVANYVKHLIRQCFDCQVVQFGSVPLKTYLPDGDIDLTALSHNTELKETWAGNVQDVLREAEQNVDAEFRVKEVQYIHADVKIIKCLVENIVVDISFNQTGGLCTLCFLETVDRLIGQNHLFKRSVILVKAWCYYESRILGAHHGLISTYALETLVLYIFHVFHSSLRGPLEVLYTFLEYFSNFDWDKYYLSLWGPVPLSSLPDRPAADAAEPPRKDAGVLLLPKDFLDACGELFLVVPAGQDNTQGRTFNVKFLNVLDPLRDTNNLGRSVNKSNFCRIRSAFGYGAKKLAGVLKSSRDEISLEFGRFFASTLERSGSGCRPDAADPGSRRNQTPITGAGSISHKERSSGTKQENGESHHYLQEAGTYLTEGGRSHVQYPSWHQQVLASRLQGGLDPSEWVSYVTGNQGDPTLWNRPPTTVSESFLVRGSSRDLGIPVNAVASTSETKQEKSRVIEAGSRTASGNTNIVGVDGQLRHVDGISGLTDSGGGEKGRVQSSGSSHDTPSVAAENSSSSNCRSSDVPEHSINTSIKEPMRGEIQAGEPSQDSSRWAPSMEDPAGKGVIHCRNSTGTTPHHANYYMGIQQGPSVEATTSSSQGNLQGRNQSGDSQFSSSGRHSSPASAAEEKGTPFNIRVGGQSRGLFCIDSSHQGLSQEHSSQIIQPVHTTMQLPPFVQVSSYGHPSPMHLVVSMSGSSSVALPALSLPGSPFPSLGLQTMHSSSSLGESSLGLGTQTNPYLGMRGPKPLHYRPSRPSAYLIPMPHLVDCSGTMSSGIPSFPTAHGEEQQREYCWSSLEEQHRPGVSTSATRGGNSLPSLQIPDRSYALGGAPPSVDSAGPFHLSAPILHQTGSGQFKPASVDSEHVKDTGADYDLPSKSSIDDGRQTEDSIQWPAGAEPTGLNARGRDTQQNGADVRILGVRTLKLMKEKRVTGKAKVGNSTEDPPEFVRSGEGPSAESPLQWLGQQSIEEPPVPGLQQVSQHIPVPTLASLVYPNLIPPFFPPHLPLSSGTSETPSAVPFTTVQMPPPLWTTVGAGAPPSPSLQSQQLSPVSGGPPVGHSSSYQPAVSELGSMGIGSAQRNRPMETTPMPPSAYYGPSVYPYFSMYQSVPSVYVIPSSSDGGVRVDSMGGLNSNGSMEAASETLGSQLGDDLRRSTPQGIVGGGARVKMAGMSISTGAKLDSVNMERGFEIVEPRDVSSDILSGDFEQHMSILEHWQLSHNPPFLTPMPGHPPYPTVKFLPRPRHWDGPGRPNVNMNPHLGVNSSHQLGGLASSLHSPGRMGVVGGNFQSRGFAGYGNEETLPKPRGGTGTYIPNLRQTYYNRDRQAPGGGRGGSQHGAYGQQDRSERGNDRDGANQVHGPRYRGVGQGRGQQTKYEPRAQNSSPGLGTLNDQKNPGSDRERNNTRPQQQQSLERRGTVQASQGSLPSPTSPAIPILPVFSGPPNGVPVMMYPLQHMNSNGKPPGMGTTVAPQAPAVVMVYPPYDGNMVYPPEALEFGSFGPVAFGAAQVAGQMASGRTSYVSGPPGSSGLSSPSGERSQLPSSPQQRSMQRTYQMNEEDFPPLSFRGQHATSSAGLNGAQESSATSRGPHYQAYVAVSPSS